MKNTYFIDCFILSWIDDSSLHLTAKCRSTPASVLPEVFWRICFVTLSVAGNIFEIVVASKTSTHKEKIGLILNYFHTSINHVPLKLGTIGDEQIPFFLVIFSVIVSEMELGGTIKCDSSSFFVIGEGDNCTLSSL